MKDKSRHSNDYAILVLSCDKYSDIWSPFFSQFHRFWPDCPFPVYLGSNTKVYKDKSVRTIRAMTNEDWSSDLAKILKQIKEQYIFVWMEDLFLVEPVDASLFLESFRFMKANNGNHMHMSPFFKPDRPSTNGLFGSYLRGTPYRVNAPGFWNKQHLLSLLIPGENPWKFEIMGSYRSGYHDGYFCINKELFSFIRVVEKGLITRESFAYCTSQGVVLDTRKRRVHTIAEECRSYIEKYIFITVSRIPWRIRLRSMETLRKLLLSY